MVNQIYMGRPGNGFEGRPQTSRRTRLEQRVCRRSVRLSTVSVPFYPVYLCLKLGDPYIQLIPRIAV